MEDFSKQFVNALLAYAAQRDLSASRLCKQINLNHSSLMQENSLPLSHEQIEQLWVTIESDSDDSLVGLHFGESMQLAALGIIGQIIYTSNTVGEALSNAGGLIRFLTDMFAIQVHQDKGTVRIQFVTDTTKAKSFPATFKHMADYLMVFVLHELDGLVMERFKPLAARFSYPIDNLPEYERIFRCPIYPNTAELSLELPARYLKLPIITANYELQGILLQKVHNLGPHSTDGNNLQIRIFNYLMTNSYLYSMSLESVANNFNMSARSLQRKLKDEGVTYLEIVEEVRKTLALHYLKSGSYQIKDIAYTLGYNESSAFLRAFKRWTGTTPTDYRKRLENN